MASDFTNVNMAYTYQPDTLTTLTAWTTMLDVISTQVIPEFALFGMDAGMFSLREWPSTDIQFLYDEELPMQSTSNGGAAPGAATVPVATGEGQFFRVGDIVAAQAPTTEIVKEQMRVTAITVDDLTVVQAPATVPPLAGRLEVQALFEAGATPVATLCLRARARRRR